MTIISNLEGPFIIEALKGSPPLRLDERLSTEFRPLDLHFDPIQRGHVMVSFLGEIDSQCTTKILAAVTGSMVRPYPERPSEGIVNYYVELSGSAIPPEDYQEYDDVEIPFLQRMIDRFLKSSRVVDTESLCVIPGEQVWSIRVDLHILQQGGNVIDALTMAAVAALYDYRKLDTAIQEDGTVKLYSTFEKHPVPLALHNPPISVSFALIDINSSNGDYTTKCPPAIVALCDPSLREQQVDGVGQFTLVMNRLGEILSMVKTKGEAIPIDLIQNECLALAKKRAVQILDMIQSNISKVRGGGKNRFEK